MQTGRQVNKPTSPARGVRRERLEPSLTKEQFFDELEVKLFEILNEDQINFIEVSRQEFKDRYDSLAAVMAIQGRELGKIHNYLPITSYRRDDSDKSDFILNMQYTPDGSYGRSRYEGDEETAINLDGASTFAGTLASMSYSINTTTTYSSIFILFTQRHRLIGRSHPCPCLQQPVA